MPDMTVHARPLITAGNYCRTDVRDLVAVAKQTFAGAAGNLGGATSALRSAAAAETCVSTWSKAYKDATETMSALGGKLTATAAAVVSADDDAADLYRGPQLELPPLTLEFGAD